MQQGSRKVQLFQQCLDRTHSGVWLQCKEDCNCKEQQELIDQGAGKRKIQKLRVVAQTLDSDRGTHYVACKPSKSRSRLHLRLRVRGASPVPGRAEIMVPRARTDAARSAFRHLSEPNRHAKLMCPCSRGCLHFLESNIWASVAQEWREQCCFHVRSKLPGLKRGSQDGQVLLCFVGSCARCSEDERREPASPATAHR